MKHIVVCGWVRCGNRWLARLLAYYADEREEIDPSARFGQDYWKATLPVHYFGKAATIAVSHFPAYGFWEDGAWTCRDSEAQDTYLIHTQRDPRDAFVSWYYVLREGGMLSPEGQTWKGYLSWLTEQEYCPFRYYVQSWLTLKAASLPNITWVSHEWMREHRAESLLYLVEQMGFPPDEERARYAADILESEPYRASYLQPGVPIERGIPGKWKRLFDAEDARLVEDFCGDLIVALGYGGDPNWERLLERTGSV